MWQVSDALTRESPSATLFPDSHDCSHSCLLYNSLNNGSSIFYIPNRTKPWWALTTIWCPISRTSAFLTILVISRKMLCSAEVALTYLLVFVSLNKLNKWEGGQAFKIPLQWSKPPDLSCPGRCRFSENLPVCQSDRREKKKICSQAPLVK